MDEIRRIRDRLRRSLRGDAWHGPALLEVLEGVDLDTAVARPIPAAHTIAELVLHVTTWIDVVTRRLDGDWRPVTPQEDFPPEPTDADGWAGAVAGLESAVERLDLRLAAGPSDLPARRSPDGAQALGLLLDGVVHHNLYHAGQIALLRKGGGG